VTAPADSYPSQFLKAIDKGMSIFPRDRFQSAAEWQAMLRADARRPVLAVVATTADRAPRAAAIPAAPPKVAAHEPVVPAASAPAAAAPVTAPEIPATVQTDASQASATATPKVATRAPRDLLISSAAAVLLLAGLLSLPGDLVQRLWSPAAVPTTTAGFARVADAAAVEGRVELENGIVLQTIETGDGPRAVVSVLPDTAKSDLQVGDVLLVYAATGEIIESATAVRALLGREAASGVATFGFAVQRDGRMAVGFMQLPDLNEADLKQNGLDLEKKT
jgi:hypothetical protein